MDVFTVAFFGHRYIENPFRVEKLLEKHIRNLIQKKEYTEFLVGRNGEFDQIVSSSVHRIRKECRDDNSSLVLMLPYVTAEFLNNHESYENYYDCIEIFHKASKIYPKAVIQLRNREMVDRADLIICFIACKSGGAYQTVRYAIKQRKKIINLADDKLPASAEEP